MKAKLLNLKAVFCLLFVLSLMCSTFCQVSQTIVDTTKGFIIRTHLNPPQTTVDTIFWEPISEGFDMMFDLDDYHDSIKICLVTKSDIKKIPLVIYTNNSNKMYSKPYETTAILELKLVEVLTGGLHLQLNCMYGPYGNETFVKADSNANTIRISLDLSGTGIVDDEDMKFAISLLDRNGNVLFACNETWWNDPLGKYGELKSWMFRTTDPSEIKVGTGRASDLDMDTLVNDYSINLVKNTLHSPLFDYVASIRLDFFPPTAKYDSILNEIENIQKKLIELCGGQFIDEEDIATEKPAPAVEERVAEEPVVESEEAVEIAEGWQTEEPAETSGGILATSKRYIFSGKYLNSKNDIDFIRDFLLAPNCLSGLFSHDIESCIEYHFTKGHDDYTEYFWCERHYDDFFLTKDDEYDDFYGREVVKLSNDISLPPMSLLLSDFSAFKKDYFVKDSVLEIDTSVYYYDPVEYQLDSHYYYYISSMWKSGINYSKSDGYYTFPQDFVLNTLLPITKEIPSHKQCRRFIELVYSWQKLIQPALNELRIMALREDTTAQLYMGQMLEQNDFLDLTLNNDYFYSHDYGERRELSDYGTPLHWYVMAALNGSRQGEKELNRLLGLKLKYNDDYYGDGEYHEEYIYKSELHDELISLLEEYERQRISQYSYDKRKDLLNKMIKEVRQNRIKERQKQEKEWEKERQKWNYNQEEAAETYAE